MHSPTAFQIIRCFFFELSSWVRRLSNTAASTSLDYHCLRSFHAERGQSLVYQHQDPQTDIRSHMYKMHDNDKTLTNMAQPANIFWFYVSSVSVLQPFAETDSLSRRWVSQSCCKPLYFWFAPNITTLGRYNSSQTKTASLTSHSRRLPVKKNGAKDHSRTTHTRRIYINAIAVASAEVDRVAALRTDPIGGPGAHTLHSFAIIAIEALKLSLTATDTLPATSESLQFHRITFPLLHFHIASHCYCQLIFSPLQAVALWTAPQGQEGSLRTV